jgi:hypothetical protein
MIKRAIIIASGSIVIGYAAWCRTDEGRLCGRLVKSELKHYDR